MDKKLVDIGGGYGMMVDKKKHKGIVAIDFDSTIAHSRYPEIGEPVKNSLKYVNKLYNDGWYIIMWTCRSDDNSEKKPESMAYDWLVNNGYPFHQMNEHHPLLIASFGNDTRKIAADVYVDDKNVFGLKSWKKIYKELSKFDSAKSVLRWAEMTPEQKEFACELDKGLEKLIWAGSPTCTRCNGGLVHQINEKE